MSSTSKQRDRGSDHRALTAQKLGRVKAALAHEKRVLADLKRARTEVRTALQDAIDNNIAVPRIAAAITPSLHLRRQTQKRIHARLLRARTTTRDSQNIASRAALRSTTDTVPPQANDMQARERKAIRKKVTRHVEEVWYDEPAEDEGDQLDGDVELIGTEDDDEFGADDNE